MRDDGRVVVALSGRTRAGKTTLAMGLGQAFDWPVGSFSRYVRREAARRGIPESRSRLQDLGAQLIVELGWEPFAAATLTNAGLDRASIPCVVEGVRHVGTLEGLRSVFSPVPVRLVHLAVSDAERNRRLAAEGVDAATGARWEQHSTEREVLAELPAIADLVVCADQPREQVLAEVSSWLGRV